MDLKLGRGGGVSSASSAGGRSIAEFEQGFFRTVRPTSLLKRFITTEEVVVAVLLALTPVGTGLTLALRRYAPSSRR